MKNYCSGGFPKCYKNTYWNQFPLNMRKYFPYDLCLVLVDLGKKSESKKLWLHIRQADILLCHLLTYAPAQTALPKRKLHSFLSGWH